MNNFKQGLGECIGTFIIVLLGCSSVAAAVLFSALNLFEIALIWGFAVALAIYATKKICPAHLNPAVSVAFLINKEITFKTLILFIFSQFLGALFAGFLVYILFNNSIELYESANNIKRGSIESTKTAMIFGEFFPNPSYMNQLSCSVWKAAFLEGLGTFVLVLVILKSAELPKKIKTLSPILIGLTITVLICLIAPFTQGGFNPARDFGPRLIAYFSAWSNAAFPEIPYSFFSVYILSPILGGAFASCLYNTK